MNEREFLQTLQERAREQEKTLRRVPFPNVFTFIVNWLSYHPWRFLIPLALLISILLRILLGHIYTNAVLWVFSL